MLRIARFPRFPLHRTLTTLAVVTTAAAAWSGYDWYSAAHADSVQFSRTREVVMEAATQAVQNLNTLDYRNFADGFQLWQQSVTGDLASQLDQGKPQFEQQVLTARSVTTAHVLAAAVTELDARQGKASVMVEVRLTVQTGSDKPVDKNTPELAELTRTPDGWRLSALGSAPLTKGASR